MKTTAERIIEARTGFEYADPGPDDWSILSRGAARSMKEGIAPILKAFRRALKKNKAFKTEFTKLLNETSPPVNLKRFELDINNISKISQKLMDRKE